MVTEGITGLQAHLLQTADGRFPEELIRQARGWPDEDWAAAARGTAQPRPAHPGRQPHAYRRRPRGTRDDRGAHRRTCLDRRAGPAWGTRHRRGHRAAAAIGERRSRIRNAAPGQPSQAWPCPVDSARTYAAPQCGGPAPGRGEKPAVDHKLRGFRRARPPGGRGGGPGRRRPEAERRARPASPALIRLPLLACSSAKLVCPGWSVDCAPASSSRP